MRLQGKRSRERSFFFVRVSGSVSLGTVLRVLLGGVAVIRRTLAFALGPLHLGDRVGVGRKLQGRR